MSGKCNYRANLLLIILMFVVVMYLKAAAAGAYESASAVKPKSVQVLEGLVLSFSAGELSSASLNLLDT
jgi:hypothetical protein